VQVCGPEEWGWTGFQYSPRDAQHGKENGWNNPFKPMPDRKQHGNVDPMTYLLKKFAAEEKASGKRLLDVFTLHFYPQGGEFSGDTSPAMVKRRARSTRALWDPAYKDETWYVLSGKFEVKYIHTKDASMRNVILNEGDVWRNEPLEPHQVICIEEGTIIEVSTPDSVEDNYRVLPGDSQTNGTIHFK
jgi:mannose-6-phosphate isomerase-like protein (cupin superfamily)